MNSLRKGLLGLACAVALSASPSISTAADATFTYQGLLKDSGTPAANYDFRAFLPVRARLHAGSGSTIRRK